MSPSMLSVDLTLTYDQEMVKLSYDLGDFTWFLVQSAGAEEYTDCFSVEG